MIHNINDLMVEVDGQLFAAANIQVWPKWPHLHWSEEHQVYYGVYFEIMFENGANLTVSQEMAEELSEGPTDNSCLDLNHFLVMATRMQLDFKHVEFAYHCEGEAELAKVIQDEVDWHKSRSSMWYSGWTLDSKAEDFLKKAS